MKLELANEQKQILSSQMQQSMQVLQMGSQELEHYLDDLSMENPLLELHPPEKSRLSRIQSVSSSFPTKKTGEEGEGSGELRPAYNYETFKGDIQEQIAVARIPELMRRQLSWLAGELDERGYLPPEPGDLAVFGNSETQYENIVKLLQSLEPAGVGARSLSECLCIQLRRRGEGESLAYTICERALDRLAAGHLGLIAKELGVSPAAVAAARSTILTLEPKPSNGYFDGGNVPFISPDIEVYRNGDGFQIVPADKYMSSLSLNTFYTRMASSGDLTEEEREYFKVKLSQAKWAMDCVSRRRDMLLTCATALVEQHRDFFLDGVSRLGPITMAQLAARLEVHPSTISRAVRDKYLSCSWGVFPLSHFFAKELSVNCDSTGSDVLSGIRQLIAAEDSLNPLSDSQLSQGLKALGINISRRTVAKYRTTASIPNAAGRKPPG